MEEASDAFPTPRRFPLAAVAFLSVVAVLFAGAVATFSRNPAKFSALHAKHDVRDLLQGRTTLEAEDLYEDLYALEDSAVGLWGGLRYLLFRTGNQGVLIGDEDWLYTTEEFEAYKESRDELEHKLEIISRVNGYLSQHNVQLIVALLPAKARIYPEPLGDVALPKGKRKLYAWFQGRLLERGVYAPDLAHVFQQQRDHTQLFMRTDTHWTPQGAELAADALERFKARDCRTLKLKYTGYKTRVQEAETYSGDLIKFVPTGWLGRWVRVPAESLRKRETVPEKEAEGEDALFAEETIPVVLVGTSYSAHAQWNFEGALKAALHSDVMNAANEGGGPMKPMADYLKAADLTDRPPQLVIWEIPERFLEKSYRDVTFDLPEPAANSTTGFRCNLDRLRWQRGQY